ncbi:hypothetical protein BaRGS_00026725 [Batillaria attramentaria]|uniref:Spondin domain-containing protein n=1 Tax=Batillaria attramentaria TaxID=370345 RepID=A0ABD0K4Y3_9CAEN
MAKLSFARVAVVSALVVLLTLSLLSPVECGRRRRGRSGRTRRNKRGNDKCFEDSVAEYKLTFYGAWSKEKFPRMYPRYRPSAQWSKIIGRTHGPTYQMWSEGSMASHALKRFAEDGDALLYDAEPQGYNGVFDTFHCEAIRGGEGKTSTFILVDGVHSKVSFVSKMVPSPDWFVGLDGLELCRRGRWRARAHVNLRPLDAGTDRGYTFTSPNWPSHPREPIYQITSSHPNHPASAFLYPEYKRLPRVAYVDVERVAQYHRRGPVSNLKSNVGNNLVVFTESATGDSESGSRNGGDLASATDDDVQETSASTEQPKPLQPKTAAGGRTQSVTPSPKPAQAKPHPATNPHSGQVKVITTLGQPTTVTSTPAVLEGGTGKFDPEASDDDLMSLQRDVAQMQELADDSRHILERIEQKKAGVLNESSRNPAGNIMVDDTADKQKKEETPAAVLETDRVTYGVSGSSPKLGSAFVEPTVDHDPNVRQVTPHRSGQPQATSVRISQHPRFITEAEALSAHNAVTSTSEKPEESPESKRSTLVQVSAEGAVPTHANVPSTAGERPPASDPNPSDVASAQPLTKSTTASTSTATNKVSPEQTTLHVLSGQARAELASTGHRSPAAASADREGDVDNPQMRSGDVYTRRRWRSRGLPSTAEPRKAQSVDTFKQPQFPEVSKQRSSNGDVEPEDCRVTEWGEWGPCSKTCGFGRRQRMRDVISHSKNGGFSCPVLQQETLCGSMRTCNWNHFTFLSTKRPRRTRRRRRHHHGHEGYDRKRYA